jgi:uncharacterized membrane protein YfcA
MTWILAYLATGAVIGLLAGLLGIGGGMTLVPVLAALFSAQQLAPAHVMHLALGTAMASIVFTASSSVREHHRLGSVDWGIVRRLAPPMMLGTLLATLGSGWVPQRALALAFAGIVVLAAAQIWTGRKPASGAQGLPGAAALWAVGLGIGLVCGLVSAGGAFLTMPFLLWRGVPVRTAIGTGAALGLPVALLGTAGYVAGGWQVTGLPAGALGFVLLPALLPVVLASMLVAPYGARLAHRLPVAMLRRVFAVVLWLLAAKMVWSYA